MESVARFVGHLANSDVTRKHAGPAPPRVPMTPADPVVKVFLERSLVRVDLVQRSRICSNLGGLPPPNFSQKLATPPLISSGVLR